MSRKRHEAPTLVLLLIVLSPVFSTPAVPHHSNAAFYASGEPEGLATFEGVLSQVNLVNPHTFYRVRVSAENGEEIEWIVETRPWLTFRRAGWTAETVGVGDRVRFTVMKNRTFAHSGRIREMLVLARRPGERARLFMDYTGELDAELPARIADLAPPCTDVTERCVQLDEATWRKLAEVYGELLPVLQPLVEDN